MAVSPGIDKVGDLASAATGKGGRASKVDEKSVAQFQDTYNNQIDTSNAAKNPFLDFISGVRNDFKQKSQNIAEMSKGDMSAAKMLQIQNQISSLTLQQDLLAKIAGKTNQTLETLLKMQ